MPCDPQVNDEGDRVDWYSPTEGVVTSWKAADEDARFRALRLLESTLSSVESLSKKSLQSPKTAQQLFGSLLSKAFQFPGENFLFLVDGKPVITFWGFVNLNENAREDILDCLRASLLPVPMPAPVIEPEPEPEPAPAIVFEKADEPLVAAPATVHITADDLYEAHPAPVMTASEPEPEPAPAIVTAKKRRVALWALPVAAVVVAAVAAPLLWPKQAPTAEPVKAVAVAPVAIAPKPVAAVEPLPLNLPLHQAEVAAVKAAEPVEAEPVVITAIPKDAMVMEAGQVKSGSTRFLNGSWRAMLEVTDPITGKPPYVRYQIQNNKGTARVVHGKNVVCRATVFSGLHSNGELLIKTRGNARCADGSRYPMPEITCKAGTNDVAECSARYDAKTVVPLTFRKAGA